MRFIFRYALFFFLIGSLIAFTSCDKEIEATDFGIFSSQDANTVIMNGVIDGNTPQYWSNYIAVFPDTDKMIMRDCPGSDDDEANLKAARQIRTQGVDIHLPANAEIASGAVDLFLAGTKRTREAGSKIGVHSWSDGQNDATAFEVGHEKHQPYIDYYEEMGFLQADAEAFYYFTINAAPAAEIHWMTDGEIEEYKLLKN
ncbi:MAG: hypothetical protein AB8B69_25520 [Chitinophagales bacterium]